MAIFAELSGGVSSPEQTVGLLGLAALSCCAIWGFMRWLLQGPPPPEPWDEQIAAELADGNCTPLCHHCLEPHEPSADFCSNCGAAVGTYTNLLPFPNLFSIGHALRIGTSERFKRSGFTIAGFMLLGFAEYFIFVPVYWFRLLQNLRRSNSQSGVEPPDPLPVDSPVGKD